MEDLIFKAKGRNGSIELYPNRLIVIKALSGLQRKLTSGDNEIYLDSIKSINFKEANSMTWGYIQFETAANSKKLKKASLMSAPNDDFTINFSKKTQSDFIKLKGLINEQRNSNKSQTIIQNQVSEADELEKLAALKDKGILTEEEFNQKKKQILGI